MAKGDSGKAQNMINSQGPLAQNYLTQQQGIQNQIQQQFQQQMFGGGGQQGGGDAQDKQVVDYINQRKGQLPPTKESLQTIVKELNDQGIPVKFDTHANGTLQSDDKILLPSGTGYDAINNVGGTTASWGDLSTPYKVNGKDVGGGAAGQASADYGNIMGQYGQFAKDGGYSPQDLANMRARAVSPIRSIYSSASNALERQKALQGGYSPNYTAATAKMAREQSQGISDANTNTEANIAQMKQSGRLAGMGGMAGMFGATPGMANMYGNQMLSSSGQGLQASNLQNQLGLGMIGAQINKAGVPSTFSQAMGNIGSVGKAAGQVGGAIAPWL